MADTLAELLAIIGAMSPEQKAALDKQIAPELAKGWLPNPGPQADAYHSKADLLLYGGAAGGGKTDLIVGLALTKHQRTVIFRRSYPDLNDISERLLTVANTRDGWNGQDMRLRRGKLLVEFGALEKPRSEWSWQGRAHDLICLDEGAQLSAAKVAFVIGWNRSTDQAQRSRVLIASNPPIGGEGDWLIAWFAPWLDPMHPSPALPGELRWAIVVGEETVWKDGPGVTMVGDEEYTHKSRTFIPAMLDDNPYLKDTGYRATLQGLPEPLRSQLLKGDFLSGRHDHEWQVIPTAWVKAAQERWEKAPEKRRAMISLALDAAGGGLDDSVLAALHADCWFAPLRRKKTADIENLAALPAELAVWMLQNRRDNADLSADCTGGWGSGVRSHLLTNHQIECASIIFSAGSNRKTRDHKLGYKNLRADMWWGLREALDPDEGDDVMLPPDTRLMAHLTAPRYKIVGTDIQIEDKEAVKQRLGASPDDGDATVIAWHRRKAAVVKPKIRVAQPVTGGGWMGRG